MNNIYIASTLSNAPRVRHLRDVFKKHNVGLTYDWTSHNNGVPYVSNDDHQMKMDVAEKEVTGVYLAKAVLVVMPGYNGTHFEFGMAFAWRKPIILLADEQLSGNLPSFHFLKSVIKTTSEQDAINAVLSVLHGDNANNYLDEIIGGL
jgi:nucleoside 2-deoxyribosyltransferase